MLWSAKKVAATVGIAATLLASTVLAGCSTFQDFSGDTCDGKKPVATLEEAARSLVTAAYTEDIAGICRVTSPFLGEKLDAQMVSDLKEILVAHEITPDNVQIIKGEQMGSGVPLQLTNGAAAPQVLDVGATAVREHGFTIGLPSQLYANIPSDPASPTTSP